MAVRAAGVFDKLGRGVAPPLNPPPATAGRFAPIPLEIDGRAPADGAARLIEGLRFIDGAAAGRAPPENPPPPEKPPPLGREMPPPPPPARAPPPPPPPPRPPRAQA